VTDNDARHTGQRGSGQIDPGSMELAQVPGRGDRDRQMWIAGQHGGPSCILGHSPVVAAPACTAGRGECIIESQSRGVGRCEDQILGPVEKIFRRESGSRRRGKQQIPGINIHACGHLQGQHFLRVVGLQHPCQQYGIAEDILSGPRFGLQTQPAELKRLILAVKVDKGIHSLCIRLDIGAFLDGKRLKRSFPEPGQSYQMSEIIEKHVLFAGHHREGPIAYSPYSLHLPKAILGVYEALSRHEVVCVSGENRRNAVGIAIHTDRGSHWQALYRTIVSGISLGGGKGGAPGVCQDQDCGQCAYSDCSSMHVIWIPPAIPGIRSHDSKTL